MAAISLLNPKTEIARALEALSLNITGAKGIQNLLKSNLGPKGTMKMLVSGSGDIKITKDGNILLHEIPIVHPTASFIARATIAVDDNTGDGTTSTVLLIGELLKQADGYISDGIHPRILSDGFSVAMKKIIDLLDKFKIEIEGDRHILLCIAQSCLSTKLPLKLSTALADICVDAVLSVQREDTFLDLHMIEIIQMKHNTADETVLIHGLVLDHGSRHPDMPKHVHNAYILTCNVSLEYEKSEVNSSFFYNTAEQRELMFSAERDFIHKRIEKVIRLKKQLCDNTDKSFVLINQKGIDPISLDMLANEGIIALRRAKSKNMERLTLACGGVSLNTFDDLNEEHLGYAGSVYEDVLGEDKFTFVEDCKFPQSVTILIKGPNKHTLVQIKEAVMDGLRAVKNAIEDKCLIPGAGAFEIAAYNELVLLKNTIKGKTIFGIQAFADALLVIPKVLAANSGFQGVEVLAKLQDEYKLSGFPVGLDINSGEPINPVNFGIYDNYSVKKQYINTGSIIASNLILVDEIMRAGLPSLKG